MNVREGTTATRPFALFRLNDAGYPLASYRRQGPRPASAQYDTTISRQNPNNSRRKLRIADHDLRSALASYAAPLVLFTPALWSVKLCTAPP